MSDRSLCPDLDQGQLSDRRAFEEPIVISVALARDRRQTRMIEDADGASGVTDQS